MAGKRKERDFATDNSKSKRSRFNCGICLNSHGVSARLQTCSEHEFCRSSVRQYAILQVREGVTKMKCPGVACQAKLCDEMLKKLLEKSEFAQYKELQLKRNPQFRECPFCDYQTIVPRNSGNLIECVQCHGSFCFVHSNSHPGKSCEEFNIEQSKNKSVILMQRITQPCPRCQAPTIKNGGCSQIRCSVCDRV
jgi:hypothetical protein